MGHRFAPAAADRIEPVPRRSLHERNDVRDARVGRRAAGGTWRAADDGCGSGDRLRVSRDRDRVLSRPLPVVLAPRDAVDAARRVGRIAARCRRSAATPWRPQRDRGAAAVSQGLGALVLRAARKPYLVSGGRILPIAASTPVVGFRPDDDPRHLRAGRGGHRGRADLAGARDVCDGQARRRRSDAGAARGHPTPLAANRLGDDDLEQLRRQLESVGLSPARSAETDARLLALRRSYEPVRWRARPHAWRCRCRRGGIARRSGTTGR